MAWMGCGIAIDPVEARRPETQKKHLRHPKWQNPKMKEKLTRKKTIPLKTAEKH